MHAIGLDIGGSKTHAVSWRDDASVAQRTVEAYAGSANLASVGEREAAAQLDVALAGLAAQCHDGTPDVVCAGAAGADTAAGARRLRDLIAGRLPGAEVLVVHDAQLILAAAGLRSGIALISGTGSVAWGRTAGGRQARAGGWGYLLGDDGSGYGIVRDAVRHVLQRLDAGLPADDLTDRLTAACAVARREELLDHFYTTAERRYWAKRSEVVFTLAALGDPVAAGLVTRAGAVLADIAGQVNTVLGPLAPLPVVLGGGVLANQAILREAVREPLAARGLTDLRVLGRDPARGALDLARDHLTTTTTIQGVRP